MTISRSKREFRFTVYGLAFGASFVMQAVAAMAWVEPPKDYPDIKIFRGQSSTGAVAYDPSNPKQLVVGVATNIDISADYGCFIKTSADGGRTWSLQIPVPQLPGVACGSLPAVAYAADGSHLFVAYTYHKSGADGVVFSVSTDRGTTWSKLNTTIFPENHESLPYTRVEIAVAPDGPAVYLVTQLNAYFAPQIYVSSSPNYGLTWNPGKSIPDEPTFSGAVEPSIAVGRKGRVLIAYSQDAYPSPAVFVARSNDRGASFTNETVVQQDLTVFSQPYPSIEIGRSGTAHLVYTKPVGAAPAVLYKSSSPPYKTWSAPVRLDKNVSGTIVSFPHIAAGACEDASILHVSWIQAKDRAGQVQINYVRRLALPSFSWSDPLRIGYFDHLQEGLRSNDLAAAGATAFATFSTTSALFGSRASSGVTCR